MNFASDGITVIVHQPLALLAAAETPRLDVSTVAWLEAGNV